MKSYFFAFVAFLLIFSCKKETPKTVTDWEKISENLQFIQNENTFDLKSGKFNYSFPKEKLPLQKVMLLNASLVGYFTELGLEEKIIGISSPEYVYSEKIHQLIDQGKITNIGNEQKYNVEKIIALKPDAVFTNHIASFENTYELLKKNGIEIIFLDEFLEQNPLQKSKYLIVFGKLFNEEEKAVSRFNEIEKSYDSLKTLARKSATKPIVLTNEIYGNQWFLPGGKTNFAQFVADANAQYINSENDETKAVPMSFEEVFVKAEKAEFWVNAGNHKTKKELLQINPNYAKMNVFNKGKIYTVTGREKGNANDYFESGVVRADLILKDYVKIFHPELLPNYELTYMKELH